MCTTYILQSETTGRYYVGSTVDLDRRLREHRAGKTAATRRKGPWRLVYQEAYPDLVSARRRERQIKAWKSRRSIQELIEAVSSVG